MKVTKRQLRGVIKEFYKSRDDLYDTTRAPELTAILDAAEEAHTSKNVSYAELKDFFWRLNSVYANDRKIMEAEEPAMIVTRKQLRRIIREELIRESYGDAVSQGAARSRAREKAEFGGSKDDPKGALAAVQEMGYSLKIPPYVDSNNMAINDALEGYPGEFTYEDIIAAVKSAGGEM